jgi:hypothetical protein
MARGPQGCEVCRRQWLVDGRLPHRLGANAGAAVLYRCDACETWWEETPRGTQAITDDEARGSYPDFVGQSSP